MNRNRQIIQTLQQFYAHPVAQVSLELIFSILAVILFSLFAIRPTLVTMSDLVKEIQDKDELNRKLTQKIAALSSVQSVYQSEKTRFGVLDEAIPSTPQFTEAISIIEKLASEQNLVIQAEEAKEVPKAAPESVPFAQRSRVGKSLSVTLTGEYQSLRQFIEAIRTLRREMVVESIVFFLQDDRGVKKLRATVTLNLQYFGVDVGAAKTATGSASPTGSTTAAVGGAK